MAERRDPSGGAATGAARARLVHAFMATFPAAVAGAVAGSVLFLLVTMVPGVSRTFTYGDDLDLHLFVLALWFASIVSVIGCWAGAAFFLIPAGWPFRRAIVRRPLPAGLLLGAAGALVSIALFAWLDRHAAFPDPGGNAAIAFCYALPTALAWTAVLAGLSRQPPPPR